MTDFDPARRAQTRRRSHRKLTDWRRPRNPGNHRGFPVASGLIQFFTDGGGGRAQALEESEKEKREDGEKKGEKS